LARLSHHFGHRTRSSSADRSCGTTASMVKSSQDNLVKLDLERAKRELARLLEREQQQTARWSELDTQLQNIIDHDLDPREAPRCLFVLLLCKLQQQGYTFQQLYALISIMPRLK